MSGKSTLPILIGVGALAALAMGKKKKPASPEAKKVEEEKREPTMHPFFDFDKIQKKPKSEGGSEKLVLSANCSGVAGPLDEAEHDSWLTTRYFELLAAGNGLPEITMQLLREQSPHCPWDDDPGNWTQFMRELYEQLFKGVVSFHDMTEGRRLPE